MMMFSSGTPLPPIAEEQCYTEMTDAMVLTTNTTEIVPKAPAEATELVEETEITETTHRILPPNIIFLQRHGRISLSALRACHETCRLVQMKSGFIALDDLKRGLEKGARLSALECAAHQAFVLTGALSPTNVGKENTIMFTLKDGGLHNEKRFIHMILQSMPRRASPYPSVDRFRVECEAYFRPTMSRPGTTRDERGLQEKKLLRQPHMVSQAQQLQTDIESEQALSAVVKLLSRQGLHVILPMNAQDKILAAVFTVLLSYASRRVDRTHVVTVLMAVKESKLVPDCEMITPEAVIGVVALLVRCHVLTPVWSKCFSEITLSADVVAFDQLRKKHDTFLVQFIQQIPGVALSPSALKSLVWVLPYHEKVSRLNAIHIYCVSLSRYSIKLLLLPVPPARSSDKTLITSPSAVAANHLLRSISGLDDAEDDPLADAVADAAKHLLSERPDLAGLRHVASPDSVEIGCGTTRDSSESVYGRSPIGNFDLDSADSAGGGGGGGVGGINTFGGLSVDEGALTPVMGMPFFAPQRERSVSSLPVPVTLFTGEADRLHYFQRLGGCSDLLEASPFILGGPADSNHILASVFSPSDPAAATADSAAASTASFAFGTSHSPFAFGGAKLKQM